MNAQRLQRLTSERLIEEFVAIALQQDEALFWGDTAKFNKLYDRMDAVAGELKARPGDHRALLVRLYGHPNLQVRLKAATRTLATSPEAARKVLEEIAGSNRQPQALDAGMLLDGLDGGTFKPS